MEDGLRDDVERSLREDPANHEPAANGAGPPGFNVPSLARPYAPPPNGHPVPTPAELLPMPAQFKSIDVRREVEKILDARKRIRLNPNGYVAENDPQGIGRAQALPSVCAYTFRDASDG